MFFCETCKISFTRKGSLERHNESKSHKKRIDKNTTMHVCSCGKSYVYRQALHTHRKKCNKALDGAENIAESDNEEVKKLKSQVNMLMDKVNEMTKNQQKSVTNNTKIETQNNIENQNVTVTINAFGQENMDYLTDNILMKCVERIYNCIPVLVEKMHFDPKHPENHNIKITNQRQPYVKIMNKDNEWKYANKNDTIEKLMEKSYTILELSFEGNKDELPESRQRRFEEYQSKFINQDRETMKNIKQNVEMVILNGS